MTARGRGRGRGTRVGGLEEGQLKPVAHKASGTLATESV